MNIDEQIVEAVKGGKSQGQRLMVSHYGQQVFAMISRQIDDVMDAEELTQDTFLRAFNNICKYDSQRSSLSTWLCRIAYRLTLDFLKRKHPFVVSMEDNVMLQADISEVQLDSEFSTGDEERIEMLQQIMDDLPPDERMLLTLHYFENRKLEECAFIMDSSPHALANRLYRIRMKLYKKMKQYGKQ